MEKIKKESQETQAPIDQTGIPPLQTVKNVEQEVTQMLEAYRDEPCYPVYFEKEVTKRIPGIDTPWIKCNPLKISVVWDVEESGGSKNENRAKYTLEESYPGYMKIEYDQEKRDKIKRFHIGGPSPQKLDRVNASLTRVSATFHLYVPPNDVEEIANTNDPSDFTVHKGTESPDAGISISNDLPGGGCDVRVGSSNIIPSEKFALARGEIFSKLEGSTVKVTEGDISIEEILSGLREGKLVKQFAAHELIDLKGAGNMGVVFKQDGTATVHISFSPITERWQVIVNTINAMGYGSDDRTFGIQVHTERTVDIVIENDQFKSAEGKTSFV
ncbi:MAG: hypothetical protein NTY03_01210, partial [Candidatus Bathyarchaeota archaeon]|nr:hypothetical protein [Candidatus Bathyarchaeota archaeon]